MSRDEEISAGCRVARLVSWILTLKKRVKKQLVKIIKGLMVKIRRRKEEMESNFLSMMDFKCQLRNTLKGQTDEKKCDG